jgi:hypothetical protein
VDCTESQRAFVEFKALQSFCLGSDLSKERFIQIDWRINLKIKKNLIALCAMLLWCKKK